MDNFKKLQKVFIYISNHKILIFMTLIITFLAMLTGLLQPMILGQIIDLITKGKFNILLMYIIFICFIELFSALLTHISSFLMTKVSIRVSTELKTDFYNNMIDLSYAEFNDIQSGNLLTRYETDISNLSDFLATHFVSFIMNFFGFIIILCFSLYINIVLTCIVILFLPISFLIERYFSTKQKNKIHKIRIKNDEYLTLFSETINGISDIKHLVIENFFKDKMKSFQLRFMKGVIDLNFIRNLGGVAKKTSFIILELVMLMVGIKYISVGLLTIGSFIALTNYSARLSNSISSIIQTYGYYKEATVSIDRLDEVNSNFKHNYDKKHLNLDNTNIFKNSLIFENVNFKYNDDSPILEGFNAEFHKSKINILLGDSGLGKSTIFKLILRFYELQDGSILIGKLNIKNIPQDYIRKNIAYVPQNPYFFNVSIYDNIRYANPQISYGEVNNIFKMVNLYDFISSLPQGIETVMQESGDNFSEGQKQRLNIARAIAKNPQIYLFDEPTSALDQENRNGILNIIHRLSSEKTVIMITHDREVSNIFDNSNVIEINNSLAATV